MFVIRTPTKAPKRAQSTSPDSNREVTAELNVTYEAKPSTPPTEAYVNALNSNIETADPIDITGFTTEVPAETGTKPQPIRLKFMTTQSRAAPAKKKLTKAHSSQSNSGLTEVASADREKTSKSQETLNNPMEQTKIIERILAETKYHVDNIRTNLNQSGNIKRTIKEEIQKSTKGLYKMVLQSIKINTGEAVDYNLEIDMRKPESNEHKLNELLEYIKTQTTTLERTQQEILSLRGEMKELKTRKTDETSNKIQEPKSQRIEQTGEDLRRELKKHSELLRNSFTRIEMLSDKIDNHQKVLEGTTYASVAAGGMEYAKSHSYFTGNQFEIIKQRYDNIRLAISNYQSKEEKPEKFIQKSASPLTVPGPSRQLSSQSQGTNSKTDEMLRKQSSNFKAFEHTVSNIDLQSVSEKWEFDHLLRAVQSRWSLIDTLHWELDSEIGNRNPEYSNKRLIFRSHIEILLNIPVVQQTSLNHIKRIHDTTLETLNAIKNLGVDVESWDPLLVHILSQKLDTDTYHEYLSIVKQPREIPNLQEFLSFLECKFTSLESARKKPEYQYMNKMHKTNNLAPQQFNKYNKSFNKQAFPAHSRLISQQANIKNNSSLKFYKCGVCKTNEHSLFYCRQFLNMTPQLKRRTVSKLNVCENCLYSHNGKPCISEKRCIKCNETHNTILHESFTQSGQTNSFESPQQIQSNSHVSLQRGMPEVLLATAIIKVQKYDGTFVNMRALIDQGSQTSLITENAAQVLGQPRSRCQGVISGVGAKESNCKGVISIKCASKNSHFEFKTEVYIMKSLIKNLPNYTFSKPSWHLLENITLADPEFYVSRPIDLLLGADIYSLILLKGIRKADNHIPIAQNTRLGWILTGNVKTLQCNVVINNLQEIQTFWEIEDISETPNLSLEDQECVNFYKSTTIRRSDGRYEKQLLAIQEQLDTIKRSEPSIEGVSYHHIHHYTVTYLVVAVAAAVAAVYGWRRIRRARRRLAPSARVEEPCDSEVNSVKLKVLSDVGQCKSNLVKSEVSDQAISERVFRKNRGTSPVRQSVFSITDTGV
ncbi:unnamed protein product, partial [Brenthis ino]